MSELSLLDQFNAVETITEQCQIVNNLGVFKVDYYTYHIHIQTNKTVSKVNYKRLMQLNGGKYLKSIDFNCAPTSQNLYTLADISVKTNKLGQEKLEANKKDSLSRKYGKSAPKRNSQQAGIIKHGLVFKDKEELIDYEMDVFGYVSQD